jgi:hypothetical protein
VKFYLIQTLPTPIAASADSFHHAANRYYADTSIGKGGLFNLGNVSSDEQKRTVPIFICYNKHYKGHVAASPAANGCKAVNLIQTRNLISMQNVPWGFPMM